MSNCSICGVEMTTRKDERRRPYAVQICSDACMAKAWERVTKALKRGVRPTWNRENDRRQSRRLTEAERVETLELYAKGLTVSEIAEKMNRTYKSIRNVVDNYELVEE